MGQISSVLLLPIRKLLSYRQVVVVAPHPDDETLGCGGAIARLCQSGVSVFVLVMSDGTQSHPDSVSYPFHRLRSLRESETLQALEILGLDADRVTFCRWPDLAVPDSKSESFELAVERCDRYLRVRSPDLIFVPWKHDHHRDHRATWHIVDCCLQAWSSPPQRFAYPIWGGSYKAGLLNIPEGEIAWRLDISSVQSLKRRAAMAHQSQTTDLIGDDPDGFRLTSEMLASLILPWETYLEVH